MTDTIDAGKLLSEEEAEKPLVRRVGA